MGAGRSRVNRLEMPVETYDEVNGQKRVLVDVDVDEDTITEVDNKHIDGILSFSMGSDELQDFLKSHNIHPTWDWDLIDNHSDEIEYVDMQSANLLSEDLRYAVYSSAVQAIKLQQAFEKATGYKDQILHYIQFSTVDALSGSDGFTTKGTEDYITVYDEDESGNQTSVTRSVINLAVDKSVRVSKEVCTKMREKGFASLNLKNPDELEFVVNFGSRAHGWNSVGGFNNTTMSHELGHSLLTILSNNFKEVNGKKFDMRRVHNLVENSEFYSDPVSGYARRNYDEAWAECCNLYFYGGKSKSKQYNEFCSIMKDYGLTDLYGCLR